MTNPMIVKLAETLQARIVASLENLKSLDTAIADAVAEAEESARNQFFLAQCQVEVNTRERLTSFTETLHEMARDSVARAVSGLLDQIEALTQPINGHHVEEPPVSVVMSGEILNPMPTPTPTIDPECTPVALPVAAHAVEAPPVGIVTEEQIDEGSSGLCPEPEKTAEDMPTSDPTGLHTRTGEGKQARYTPVEEPISGETYYQRVGRKWLPIRFQA